MRKTANPISQGETKNNPVLIFFLSLEVKDNFFSSMITINRRGE